MKLLPMIAALPLLCASPVLAQDEAQPVTPLSIVAASQAEEWVEIAPEDILIMRLADDGGDGPREVVIQLMPPPFSQPWVENIRTLARAHWWDGTSVYRVVDNWVTQWGDASEEKVLPDGLNEPGADAYTADLTAWRIESEAQQIEGESESAQPISLAPVNVDPVPLWHSKDAYSDWVDFHAGWPVSTKGFSWQSREAPIHCYGYVGVARDIETTGTGSELYAVIGHAPRQLDHNIAVVGRVIEGMEHLSTMKRGTGDAGVYESRDEDTVIEWVRLASDVEESSPASTSGAVGREFYRYEYMDTDSDSFAAYMASRANRNDAFYTVPAGGVDICNVQVPLRWIDPEGAQ